jgi:Tfp pilus assembly protein PilO
VQQEWAEVREAWADDQAHLVSLRQDFSELRKALFSYKETKEWFCNVKTLAADHGCTLKAVHLGSSDPIHTVLDQEHGILFESLDAQLTVVGSFGDLRGFIQQIQEQPRYVFIRSFKMESREMYTEPLECHVSVTVYMLHEPETERDGVLL